MSEAKFLKFHGRSATIRNFSSTGTDSYGDDTTSSSTTTANVVVDRNLQQTDISVTEIGQDVRIDALIYIDDEEDIKDNEGGDFPTEVDVDNVTFEILAIHDLNNGILECLAKRV